MATPERSPQFTALGHVLSDKASVNAALTEALAADSPLSLTQLPGSFSGIIDGSDEILAFSDLAGQFPLYFSSSEGATVSPHAHELAQQLGSELDTTTLAAQMCGLVALTEGYSMFQDVSRLTGGEQVRIAQNDLQISTYQTLLPDSSVDRIEAANNSRKSIGEAIVNRANPHLTTDFSGGLDSTTLAFAAARIHDQTIPAFVHYSTEHAAGDIVYARRFAALDPRIKLYESKSDKSTLPFANLNDTAMPFLADEPYRGVAIFGREQGRKHLVSSFDSAIHLNGIGGDALYDGKPQVADLLRDGLLQQAWDTAIILGRTYLTDPEKILRKARFQADITLPQAFVFLAETLTNLREPSWSIGWLSRPTVAVDWLTSMARDALAERAMVMAAKKSSWPNHAGIGDFTFGLQIRDSADAQRHQRYLMDGTAVLAAPFLDSNVILAAASLPASERNKAGSFKSLLKEAAGGYLVPEQIYAERQGKGNYSAEMYQGIRRSMPDIHTLLSDSRLAELGIIEPAAVRTTLDTIDSSLSFPMDALTNFVATELWLRQREIHSDTPSLYPAPLQIQTAKTTADLSPHLINVLDRSYTLSEHLRMLSGPEQIVLFDTTTELLEMGQRHYKSYSSGS